MGQSLEHHNWRLLQQAIDYSGITILTKMTTNGEGNRILNMLGEHHPVVDCQHAVNTASSWHQDKDSGTSAWQHQTWRVDQHVIQLRRMGNTMERLPQHGVNMDESEDAANITG